MPSSEAIRVAAAPGGELMIGRPEFSARRNDHEVLRRTHGVKRYRHPVVGDLEFAYEAPALPDELDRAGDSATLTATAVVPQGVPPAASDPDHAHGHRATHAAETDLMQQTVAHCLRLR